MSSPGPTQDLLRLLTAGSVDDGKSTLIGRLLYESQGVYEDQMESIRKASARKNTDLDLSLITDGLRAEREQGITIDVAYRYFSTEKRKFIIADAPGHEQHTRNMVTGASTSDLAVLLVDARKGVLEQTLRHAYIVWLLGIRRLVVAVNKMDLAGFEQEKFGEITKQFAMLTAFMEGVQPYFVPVSALKGDNVVKRSANMEWYPGPTLLQLLESIPAEEDRNLRDFRFPVQNVIRPDQDFRGYAGQVISGTVRPGQEVMVLPSGSRTKITELRLHKQILEQASPPQSIVLSLADHVDLGRGDMLVDPERMPLVSSRFHAELIWMSSEPLNLNTSYLLKHTTQVLCCSITRLFSRKDMRTLKNSEARTLQLNDIGAAELETHKPMFFDPYLANRAMGSFILIDPMSNDTVGAGVVSQHAPMRREWRLTREGMLPAMNRGQAAEGLIVWFTGLSGSGKTTICRAVYTELMARGMAVEVLDGDVVRKHLSRDLGFSKYDRDENVRRIGFVAQLLARHGVIVLVAAISPYRSIRDEIRQTAKNFIEVYVNASLEVCEQRDPKRLYKKARAGYLPGFTGITDPYEPPLLAEVQCHTERESIKTSSEKVVSAILQSLEPAIPRVEEAICVAHVT